jgi:hypothetical protein
LFSDRVPDLAIIRTLCLCIQLEIAEEENKELQGMLNDAKAEDERLQGMLNDVKAENRKLHNALSSIHQTTKVN